MNNLQSMDLVSKRSRQLVAVICGIGLTAAACGGSTSEADAEATTTTVEVVEDAESTTTTEAETTTTEATTTTLAAPSTVDAPVIEVIDQGAEPRTELRYAMTDGVYNARLSQLQSLSQTIDGQLASEITDLENIFEIEVTVATVADGFELRTEYVDVNMGEGTDPATAEAMIGELESLVGSAFIATLDDQGYVLSQTFEPSPDAAVDAATQEFMTSIAEQNQLANPLPTEPMGVGGSWKQTQELTVNGIDVIQETVYTVVSIDGTIVTLDMTGNQIVEPGPIAFPGLPDSVTVSVESWDVTTVGSLVYDFTTPLPTSQATVSGLQTLVGEGAEEFHLVQELTNVATITPVG